MTAIHVSYVEHGRFLRVITPHSAYFQQAAKTLKGRWERGAWIFFATQERQVRASLLQIFGDDGQSFDHHNVMVELRPGAKSVGPELEVAGRVIVSASDEDLCLIKGRNVQIKRGTFKMLLKGAHLSARVQVGSAGASVVLLGLPSKTVSKFVKSSHPWILESRIV